MSDTEFLGAIVVALVMLISLISSIVVPLLKLNSTLTELKTLIGSINSLDEIRDKRLNEHSRQIDEHEKKIAEHEVKIKHLEE